MSCEGGAVHLMTTAHQYGRHNSHSRHTFTQANKKEALSDAETKMDYGIARARLSLAMLEVGGGGKAMGMGTAGTEELDSLSQFMSLKSGTRALLNFIADFTASEGVANDTLLHAIEESIHEFEEKYQNFTAFPNKEKLVLILQLIEVRDKAVCKACNMLMSKLGFGDFHKPEKDNDHPHETVNAEVNELLSLFKSFKSMAKTMKMVSYTSAEADMSLSLYELQQKMTEMQVEVKEKDHEILKLSSRLKSVTQEVGRQQVIISQQKEIDEMELLNRSLKTAVENFKKERKTLIQSESMTKDLLAQAQHKMKTLQEKMEKQNSALKPQIQQTLINYEKEMKDLKLMKQELILSDSRANHLETQYVKSKTEIQNVENKLNAANLRNEADTLRLEVVMKENDKQKRINAVVIAAKMEAEKRTRKAHMEQEQTHIKLSEKQSEITELYSLIKTKDEIKERLQKQVDGGMITIKAKEKEIAEFESRFEEIRNDSRVKQEYITNLEKKIKDFEVAGMTKEAKIEMSIVKDSVKSLQDENKKLKDSLKKVVRERDSLRQERKELLGETSDEITSPRSEFSNG